MAAINTNEALKRTAQAVGSLSESIAKIKNCFSEKVAITSPNPINGTGIVHNTGTITDKRDLLWKFKRTEGYVGMSVKIGSYDEPLTKKYKIKILNKGTNNVRILFAIGTAQTSWGPLYATSIGTWVTTKPGEIKELAFDGSILSSINNRYGYSTLIARCEGVSDDLNNDNTVLISLSEITNSYKTELGDVFSIPYSESANSADIATLADRSIESDHADTSSVADLATVSDTAKQAGFAYGIDSRNLCSIIASSKINASGYSDETINASYGKIGITGSVNKATHECTVSWKKTDGFLNESDHTVRIWTYAIVTLELNSLVGENSIILLEYDYPEFSGNVSTSLIPTKVDVSTSYNSWGVSLDTLTNSFANSDKGYIELDLDDFNEKHGNAITKDGTKYYLKISFNNYVSNIEPNSYATNPFNEADIIFRYYITNKNNKVIATELVGFNPDDYYKKDEIDSKLDVSGKYITCWGDSLTAGGGWTTRLAELTGMTVYNGGTGGENARTIVARQGADVMMIDGITIPASTTPVLIAKRTGDVGILSYEGYKVTPLLQGGAHVNPCKIGDIEGTLQWTGANYSDTAGTWTFTRTTAGNSVVIDRPTAIRTAFDINRNSPHLMIIFIGQNGGYDNIDDLIRKHRLMIEHANASNFIVLGLSSGTTVGRKDYEDAMKKEFGRYFISLREYLVHPIYQNGEIISCYGLADQGLAPDNDYSYNGKTTLQEIAEGTVPHQILADGVHYTSGTKIVIGNMLYRKCCELGIF